MNEIVLPRGDPAAPVLRRRPPTPRPTTAASARSSATRSATASTTRARSTTATATCATGGPTTTATAFERAHDRLIAQYDALRAARAAPGHHVNGALTIGENIGDLGGLTIALKAYQLIALGGEPRPPEIDGFTGVQRLLLELGADLAARRRASRGGHPPSHDRPALAARVPLQPHRPQHRRVLRGVRRHRRRRAVPRTGAAGADLELVP